MKLDRIGPWSEVKLEILRKYVAAYNRVLQGQEQHGRRFRRIYIDAFAGAGEHISRTSGMTVPGSPLGALEVIPPFDEYHLIDMNPLKVGHLRELVGDRPGVFLYEGDCNQILCEQVFPTVRYEDYRRAFCFLDPYGLHLRWDVFQMAAEMRTIEILVNFPTMDINMNCGPRDPGAIRPDQADRLTAFWGDDSWWDVVYTTDLVQRNLFDQPEKAPNDAIAEGFRRRLREVAGFEFVADPIAMKNSTGATVYYLLFASPNKTGAKIAADIFAAYRR